MTRLLSVLLLAVSLPLFAQTAAEDPVHQELRRLKTTMEKALNERDLDAIVANVDPNVVFTTMNGDVCRGPEQIRAYFNKMLSGPGAVVKDVKVAFEVDALSTLYGGDAAVAYGSSRDHYELTGGDTFDIAGRWSCTMVRNENRWVIASFHYSANIFDNPLLTRLKKLAWPLGLGGTLIGLILGVVIGRLTGRKN